MTMNDRVDYIENSKDLKKEIARLRALKAYQEDKIKLNVKHLKSSFAPANLVSEAASAVLEGARKPRTIESTLVTGLNWGLNFLTDKVIFRKRGFLTRTIGGMILRTVAKKYLKKTNVSWSPLLNNVKNQIFSDKKHQKNKQTMAEPDDEY